MVPVSIGHASQETSLDAVASPSRASPVLPSRLETRASGSGDALSALVDLLQPDLEACNRTIVARMDSPVALIPQLAAHIVAAGGKRLRPLLTLAAARLFGFPGPAGGAPPRARAACAG